MARTQNRNFRVLLPLSLVLLGATIVVLSSINLFVQQRQASADVRNYAERVEFRTDQQIATLQSRISTLPSNHETFALLGSAYLQKARETGDPSYYTQGEEFLTQALALEPMSARALSLMGSLSLARHDFDGAVRWAQRALEVNSFYPAAYGILGDAQTEQGQYDAALENYQKMLNLKPNLDSYARASHTRELMGDTEDAIELMTLAVAAGTPGSENAAWARVQVGDLYFGSGKVDQAAEHYEVALAEFPNYYLAMGALARSQVARGNYQEAIENYRQAIEINQDPLFLAALGDLYLKIGDSELAQAQYDSAEANARLETLLLGGYNRELVLFYADRGIKVEEALELAAKEIAVRQDIYGYDALAWALYQNRRNEEAAEAIDKALALGTHDAMLHYHAGKIFQGLGDYQQAVTHLQRALELNPHFSILQSEDARKALANMGI